MIINSTKDSFEFDVLNSDVPVMVDMWAPWCGPCRIISPIVDEVAESIGDKAKVVKVNLDENPEIAQKYKVMGIPALLFFKDGKLVDRMSGVQNYEVMLNQLEYYTGLRTERPDQRSYRATRAISPLKAAAAIGTVVIMLGVIVARALGG